MDPRSLAHCVMFAAQITTSCLLVPAPCRVIMPSTRFCEETMFRLPAAPMRLCDGITRRDLLRAGSLGWLGLSLPNLFRLQQAQAAPARRAPADACILVYCWGAPSQFEILDPKPDAPAEVRRE